MLARAEESEETEEGGVAGALVVVGCIILLGGLRVCQYIYI